MDVKDVDISSDMILESGAGVQVDLENRIVQGINLLEELTDHEKRDLERFFESLFRISDEKLKNQDDYLKAAGEAVKVVEWDDDTTSLSKNVKRVLQGLGVEIDENEELGDLVGVSEEEKELKLREMVEGLVKSMIPEEMREKMGEVMDKVGEFVKNIDWKKVGKWLVIAAIAIVIFIVVVLPLLKVAAMGYGAAMAMQQQR